MNDFFIMFISILVSFLLGCVVILFTAGKTTLNYLRCKMKKNKNVFVWVDTQVGRDNVVGQFEGDIKKGTVTWNWLGKEQITEVTRENFGRWKDINFIAVNIENPHTAYILGDKGELPRSEIDSETFKHILTRALTKPNLDEDMQHKLLIGIIFLVVVALAGIVILYFKVEAIEKIIQALNVI